MGMCQSCDLRRPVPYSSDYKSPNQNQQPNLYPPGQYPSNQHPSINQSQNPTDVAARSQGPVKEQREILPYVADLDDDFVTHHLKHELSLTKYVSTKRIQRRQIAEHIILTPFWNQSANFMDPELRIQTFSQTFIYAYIQRTFMDIWQDAHQQLFHKDVNAKVVRKKICEQFMFQIYEMKQYVESGLTNIYWRTNQLKWSMFNIMQYCDDAILNLFKKLKQRYPQTGQTDKINFPDVPSFPEQPLRLDLLKNFRSLSFSDPSQLNYQTTYQDLRFLLKTAIELQDQFTADMKSLLGEDALGCPKVAMVQKNGQKQFNACAVRRIFVKWVQNLLEMCPELYFSKAYLDFIRSKALIINNFYFKSTIQPTTHKIVIECISHLLQEAKYHIKDSAKREEFIFNVYDLLRCKVKRNSPQQVVALLQKMKQTTQTKSGKFFQVVRVKNRFETGNRDLLINFRYGEVIVGEAQLCIDEAHISKQAKKNHQFCHFIYQLERSIFGPTLQIMMQYEDMQRPDITVKFQAEGPIQKRESKPIRSLKYTERLCLNGHNMVSLVGNFFIQDFQKEETTQEMENRSIPFSCNYCGSANTTSDRYDYCPKCACTLCSGCAIRYMKFDINSYWISIERHVQLPDIQLQAELKQLCQSVKAPIVLFWMEGSSPSQLMRDAFILQITKMNILPNYAKPIIALANQKSNHVKALCKSFGITEFPTLVLFNQAITPIRKLVGAQWFEVPIILKTQQLILSGQSPALQLYCLQANCGEMINLIQKSTLGEVICLMCFNISTESSPQLQKIGGLCSKGHYRCISCCYAALDIPSSYKDPFGSYLSVSFSAKPNRCPSGHLTEIVKKNPYSHWLFNCYTCQKMKIFDEQHGIGYCSTCKVAECTNCLGYKTPSLKQMENSYDMANHSAISTSQQSYKCMCKQPFKKTYSGCLLDLAQYSQATKKNPWTCYLCKYKGQDGQLHMACFGCPAFTAVMTQEPFTEGSKRFNFQICNPCARRSGIVAKQSVVKPKRQMTYFKCPSQGHQIISTTEAFDSLKFSCYFCHIQYFANTERFYCITCKISFCKNQQQCKIALWKGKPPTVQHKCPKGHQLQFEYARQTLQFCDGCMLVLKDGIFSCRREGSSSYSLCYVCVSHTNSNYVGKIFQNLNISPEERKKMQENQNVNIFGDYWPQAKGFVDKLNNLSLQGIIDDFFS